jgi:hypothetical protein
MVLLAREYEETFGRLTDQLRAASTPTPELFSRVVTDACLRIETLSKSGKPTPIDKLIRAGAWTDASLAIVEFELPMWTLRRLIFDAGEWFCSLSRHPTVPIDRRWSARSEGDYDPAVVRGREEATRRRDSRN